MSKHTPGKIRRTDQDTGDPDNPCVSLSVDAGGDGEWHCTVVAEMRDRLDANGRLIEAAPELLAACEFGGTGYSANVLLWNAGGILIQQGKTIGNDTMIRMGEELKAKGEREYAAIAKAKGGTQ